MPSKLVVGYSAACKKTMSYSSKNIKYSLANVSKKAKFSLDNVFLSETLQIKKRQVVILSSTSNFVTNIAKLCDHKSKI